MMLDNAFNIFLCGVFGGFLSELLKWHRLRSSKQLPLYLKSPFYWIITILIIVSGGILSLLYSSEKMNAILCVNIGISAPLIIQNLSRSVISINKDRLDKNENELESQGTLSAYQVEQSIFFKFLFFLSE
jgi:hypothetical protein